MCCGGGGSGLISSAGRGVEEAKPAICRAHRGLLPLLCLRGVGALRLLRTPGLCFPSLVLLKWEEGEGTNSLLLLLLRASHHYLCVEQQRSFGGGNENKKEGSLRQARLFFTRVAY